MWNEFWICKSLAIGLQVYGFLSSGLIDKMKIFEYARVYQGSFQFKDNDKFVTFHNYILNSLGTELSKTIHSRGLSVFSCQSLI